MGRHFVQTLLITAFFLTSCNKTNNPQLPPAQAPIFDHTYTVSTVAGSGTAGFKDGDATSAQFNMRYGIAKDNLGNIYIADGSNNSIRKITADGSVKTLAGSGVIGAANGTGNEAQFYFPQGLVVDAAGNVYVADTFNNKIRKVTADGVVSTIAGTGNAGNVDGDGPSAQFNAPSGLAFDASGNLLVTDFNNGTIRKITTAGNVKTLPGIARLSGPQGIAVDATGNIYVAESGAHVVRKIAPGGILTTLAGAYGGGFADGRGEDARFFDPEGVTIDGAGNLYVADLGNNRIRKITPAGMVTTVAGGGPGFANGTGPNARFYAPSDITIDAAGNLFVMDVNNHVVRKIVY